MQHLHASRFEGTFRGRAAAWTAAVHALAGGFSGERCQGRARSRSLTHLVCRRDHFILLLEVAPFCDASLKVSVVY